MRASGESQPIDTVRPCTVISALNILGTMPKQEGDCTARYQGLSSSSQYLRRPDGARIAFGILGAQFQDDYFKTPVVFVGGMISCRHDFDRIAALVAKSRAVLLLDYRGMGDSTTPPNDKFTIEGLARDLVSVLEMVAWKRVAIVSHSMGGLYLLFSWSPRIPRHPY